MARKYPLPPMGDVGTVIRRRRDDLDRTQAEVFGLCGVSEPAISLIERGKRRPEYDTILAIVTKGLDWSMGEFQAAVEAHTLEAVT